MASYDATPHHNQLSPAAASPKPETKGRPALEEGPVGPSGRVKGEWLTCQKSETASQHVGPCSQEPPNTADAERAAEAEGQVAVVCRATAGHAALG